MPPTPSSLALSLTEKRLIAFALCQRRVCVVPCCRELLFIVTYAEARGSVHTEHAFAGRAEGEGPRASHGFFFVQWRDPGRPKADSSKAATTAKSCLFHLYHLYHFRPSRACQARWGGKGSGDRERYQQHPVLSSEVLLPALCRHTGGLVRGLSMRVTSSPGPASGNCLWPIYS